MLTSNNLEVSIYSGGNKGFEQIFPNRSIKLGFILQELTIFVNKSIGLLFFQKYLPFKLQINIIPLNV